MANLNCKPRSRDRVQFSINRGVAAIISLHPATALSPRTTIAIPATAKKNNQHDDNNQYSHSHSFPLSPTHRGRIYLFNPQTFQSKPTIAVSSIPCCSILDKQRNKGSVIQAEREGFKRYRRLPYAHKESFLHPSNISGHVIRVCSEK